MSAAAYNIVLLPEARLAEKAAQVSEQLSSEGTLYTLNGISLFPHVSLYMVQLKAAQLAAVERTLARVAASHSELTLTAEGYGGKRGFINASYERSEAIDSLQMAIIEGVNPLRDGLVAEEKALQETATGLVAENIEKYGFQNIGELYVPHLTLTRFSDRDTSFDTLELPPHGDFSGQFPEIGLFEMGEHGTCIREITRVALATPER